MQKIAGLKFVSGLIFFIESGAISLIWCWNTVFPLIAAGSHIQAGSLIQAGGQTSFVPIEAGSLIQAGSPIEAGGSKGEYTARLVGLPDISLCSNKYKTKNLGVLNTCSSVNRVVLIEAGSLIETGGSDTIVIIEAGGFY